MAEAYEVYLDPQDNYSLTFDQGLELDRLPPPETMTSTDVHLNSDADSMAQSVGQGINVDRFVDQHIPDKSKQGNAKSLLSYLVYSVDSSTLRFTSDGQVFFQGTCVPEAHLATILQSLVNKKQKYIATGEYCLIMCLREAPDYIKGLIHPSKLKLCNIHLREPSQPKSYPAKPPKTLHEFGGPLRSSAKLKVVGAAPYPLQGQPRQVKRQPPLDTSKPGVSNMKKRLNVYKAEPKKPWYTLK